MVNDFLFELGCEELPSGSVLPLSKELAYNMKDALEKAEIAYDEIKSFATPRRLAVLISKVAKEQPSQTSVKRGPAVAAAYDAEGKFTPALLGFARSCGVDVEQLSRSKTDKGEWFVYESHSPGAPSETLLPALVQQALANLPIPKPMRWGTGDDEFSRPVHWAVMLWGKQIIKASIFGMATGRITYGHRFHHPHAVQIDQPADYEQALHSASVVADFGKRRQLIVDEIEKTAAEARGTAIMPEELVDEVTSIVEWPQALLASFDQAFLDVPPEALIASMQSHQKCFPLKDESQQLMPLFIAISNIESKKPKQVIAGNEKVMRARLSDAAFFFEQDKKQTLSRHLDSLSKVIFQAKLGSLLDKSLRIQGIMEHLIKPLGLDREQAMRAAELSKCDLMTGMVGEFPELQGLMGYYYARHDGEKLDVAVALNEQYLPRFAGDGLPQSSLGRALSLADRLDTLVGIFAIGQKPTGMKDPFKLRRHALAIVRMLVTNNTELNLSELIEASISAYGRLIDANEPALKEIQAFILERLHSYYQAQAVSNDIVLAVRARQADNLYDFDQRIQALLHFINLPEASSLSAACKRVSNILQQQSNDNHVDSSLFSEVAEQHLYASLLEVEERSRSWQETKKYSLILNQLAGLKTAVDAFFERVMVMVDEEKIKANRLALLSRLQVLLQSVADISVLQTVS
ncbi:glycine--tRNA ligase subunit beta [Legionella genomosp. 1]|uniref:glycine--tRNA ligase subunit beta n=1 Tax=Legionella genomosp. 1 TaxID=1093625 RepID=UPI001054A2CC|nr:glycine--tRNA ligase subunit beta [Legionella genomosp. 1]